MEEELRDTTRTKRTTRWVEIITADKTTNINKVNVDCLKEEMMRISLRKFGEKSLEKMTLIPVRHLARLVTRLW